MTNRKVVEDAVGQSSVIIHLAANTNAFKSFSHPLSTIRSNFLGTCTLLEAVKKNEVDKFIYLSSSEVYGNHQKEIEMNENHPLIPLSPYAVSKLASDRLAYSLYLTNNLPVVILRPFNVYGPFQHPEKMIPKFVTLLMRNKKITLNNGGFQTRDWIYVDDLTEAILKVVRTPIDKIRGEIFNVGTGKAASVKQVADIILKNLGRDESLIRIAPGLQPGTIGNIGISSRAREKLNWVPKVNLEEGIQMTVDWYKENEKWWSR